MYSRSCAYELCHQQSAHEEEVNFMVKRSSDLHGERAQVEDCLLLAGRERGAF